MENKLFISGLVKLLTQVTPGFSAAIESTYEPTAPVWFLTFVTVFVGSFIVDKAYRKWFVR